MKSLHLYWMIWSLQAILLSLIWIEVAPIPSPLFLSAWSAFLVFFISHYFWITPKLKYLGLSHVHFLYAAICAFGLDWMRTFIGDYTLENYRDLSFLYSPNYYKAIVLSMIAFLFYPLGCVIGIKTHSKKSIVAKETFFQKNITYIGLLFLLLVALYFVFMLATGMISIGMDYSLFREVAYENDFYSWAILLYSIGLCWSISCGNEKQQKVAWGIFAFSAAVFFLTGNRGEVLYAILTVIALMRYKGLKINVKLIFTLIFVAFILIPIVKASRHAGGIFENLSDIKLNISEFFTELGMQLRCTIIILDDFARGIRDYLFGYSYYGPIVNHIPGLHMTDPHSFNFKEEFATMGFNQIAEGYANFGILGSIAYFTITSWYLSKNESKQLSMPKLALIGSICSELINISRNKFLPFFPHIAVILFLYYFVKQFSKIK